MWYTWLFFYVNGVFMYDTNKKIAIGSIIGGVSLLLVGAIILSIIFIPRCSSPAENSKKNYYLKQINKYIEKEEFTRALDMTEEYLKQVDQDDKEMWDLQDKILQLKKDKEDKLAAEKDKNEKDKLDSMLDNLVDKENQTPVIIRTNNSTNEDDNLSSEEKKKQETINKLIDEGIEALNDGNFAKAKSKFLEALNLDNDNAEANAYLGTTLYQENPEDDDNVQEAIKLCKKAIKKDDSIEEAHYTLAQIYEDSNNTDLAIEYYKNSIALNPSKYQSYYALGKIYYKARDYKTAEFYFKETIKIKSDFVKAYFYLGLTSSRLKENAKAIGYYNKVIDLDPKFVQAYSNIGQIYINENDYNNAITNYKKAIDLDNKYTYHRKLAECYTNLGRIDDAISSYSSAIAFNQKSSDSDKKTAVNCYIAMSDLKNKKNDFNGALSSVNEALQLDSQTAQLYFISAFSKSKLGSTEEAVTDYIKTISLDKNYTEAYINLSDLYIKNSDYTNAISIAKEGIKNSKGDASQYKLYNNLGTSLEMSDMFEEASLFYKKSIDLNSNADSAIYFNLANCYRKMDKNDEAVTEYRKAIDKNSNLFDAYYKLGETYFILQKYDETIAVLKLLLDKKPDYSERENIERMISVSEENKNL